ncbi:MAG TPA: orotate phosphoribosyltransferase [Clostridiaceae bacterium]|nr:orotate phosphoribosyltransferase [Clostridiaceae bacterium]
MQETNNFIEVIVLDNFKEKLVSMLFGTSAIRVCPENKPFWYTSGTIGPYYVNTHFLYGSEEKANELLAYIDKNKSSKLALPEALLHKTFENYKQDEVYKSVVDEMCRVINEKIGLGNIEYVSGGERRDWFFSLIIAFILKKPHITIYKDLDTVLTDGSGTKPVKEIKSGNVLHIADLITEASSFERAWIPAVKNLGGMIRWSLVVVDRNQGGSEFLEGQGIKPLSMIEMDMAMFEKALSQGLITKPQYNLIVEYIKDPYKSMKKFMEDNPDFLAESLKGDEKTRERARLCIEKGCYKGK